MVVMIDDNKSETVNKNMDSFLWISGYTSRWANSVNYVNELELGTVGQASGNFK